VVSPEKIGFFGFPWFYQNVDGVVQQQINLVDGILEVLGRKYTFTLLCPFLRVTLVNSLTPTLLPSIVKRTPIHREGLIRQVRDKYILNKPQHHPKFSG
jgi:hypothetical protein